MKTFYSFVLTVLISFSGFFFSVHAEEYNGIIIDGIYYDLSKNLTHLVNGEWLTETFAIVTYDLNSENISTDPTNEDWVIVGGCYEGDITIPDQVTYGGTDYPVRGIGQCSFLKCPNLTSISLPSTLRSIGNWAFEGCTSLKKITIPNSVTYIGSCCFRYCDELCDVILPENLETLEEHLFEGCNNLKTIKLPNSLKKIKGTFYNCYGLKEITIPSSVEEIESGAFRDCTNLEELVLPEGIKYVAFGLCYNCTNLKSITIPSSVISIRKNAFQQCNSLTSIIIPESVKYLEDGCFGSCINLTNINIPSGITEIPNGLFGGCSSLKSVNIPEGVTSIGGLAFAGCESLESISLPQNLSKISSQTFYECSSLKKILFPEKITAIESSAFQGCSNLKSLNIPEGVISIGPQAFMLCNNLEFVILPKSLQELGEFSFYINSQNFTTIVNKSVIPQTITENIFKANSQNLTIYVPLGSKSAYLAADLWKDMNIKTFVEDDNGLFEFKEIGEDEVEIANVIRDESNIEIPDVYLSDGKVYRITSIGQSTFYYRRVTDLKLSDTIERIEQLAFEKSDIKRLTLGNSLKYIGTDAFKNTNLNVIYLPNLESWLNIEIASYEASPVSLGTSFYLNNERLEDFVIPESVTEIGDYQFQEVNYLNSIVLHDNITSIGEYAFELCSSIKTFTVPSKVKEIKTRAFSACYNLVSMNLPEGLNKIGEYAFYGSRALEDINIPDGVKEIGECAFAHCIKLKTINIPDGIAELPEATFESCAALEKVRLPESLISIGEKTFSCCRSLIDIVVPEGVVTIGNSGFSSCVKLETISLPRTLTSIGNYAFSGCESMKTIVSKNTVPPTCGKNVFTDVPTNECILYVPLKSIDTYKTTSPWKEFKNILPIDPETFVVYDGNSVGKEYETLELAIKGATTSNALIFVSENTELEENMVCSNIAAKIALTDAEPFYCPTNVAAETISYKREFKNTEWQALYLPFAVDVADLTGVAKIAYLNNVHQYDEDEDGEIERTVLEFITMKSGSTEPNVPYVIKPLEVGELEITVENATLVATPDADGYVDCASSKFYYKIGGNYQPKSDLYENGTYALKDGNFTTANNPGQTLKPFRVYLNVSARNGSPLSTMNFARSIGISVDGEETTSIDVIGVEAGKIYYDLRGNRIVAPMESGFYVCDGKMVFIAI